MSTVTSADVRSGDRSATATTRFAEHRAAPPVHPLERSRDLWLMLVNELLDGAESDAVRR